MSPSALAEAWLELPDRSRFETTYHQGGPDGPLRAYFPDGALWGEATYVKSRVTGPSWLHTCDGRKFDELADGGAAQAAGQALDTH